ncbi:MAG: ATP-binding protein [Polaromonas sp.]|nr:ATP-binding protein [Polaromonas sp.]
MQLRFLQITGPQSAPAAVEFGPGLNVIYGGSNTGKSHILRLIDFVLGAKTPPEPIVEQAGYDLVHLGILLDDGSERTLIRALQGGDVKLLKGLIRKRPEPTEGESVSAQHGAKNSLSKMLLTQFGANAARVRTDASGKTRDLSFRDLERHALINETKIQETQSPILSGQYITKTAETSVFKYLLTGVDDSALDLAKPDKAQPLRQAAQLELLDRQILEFEREIAETDQDEDPEELARIDAALDEELARSFQIQETTEVGYRDLTSSRRAFRHEYETAQDRIAEIDTLHARFSLLAEHYASDEQRLASIVEAGAFFTLEDGATCPVCGADATHQRPDQACEGDVMTIVAAASAEAEQLKARAAELLVTMTNLISERDLLGQRSRTILEELESVQVGILREVPSVQNVRNQTSNVIQKKLAIQKSLEVFRRRNNFVAQRASLGVSPGYDSSTIVAQQQLDGGVLDSFSQVVEAELQAWQFPDAKRVFFELPKMDISVAGKSRASNGKGVRALLHGAFSVALMKYCREKRRAHPGFLILDSLFITYKDPTDAEDAAIASTPLRDRAFRAFSQLPDTLQLIVLENVDVPEWLIGKPQCIHFSGEPSVGRAGLFPVGK